MGMQPKKKAFAKVGKVENFLFANKLDESQFAKNAIDSASTELGVVQILEFSQIQTVCIGEIKISLLIFQKLT